MMLNNYNPSTHLGTQPIRVLQHNIIAALEATNPAFLEQTRQLVAAGRLKPGISYHVNEEPIMRPKGDGGPQMPYLLNGREINIHETFLSYVWCMSYALITLYEERVAKPDQNRQAQRVVQPIEQERAQHAEGLFQYALRTVRLFDDWNRTLLNPEEYNEAEGFWIGQINAVYTYAITFILQHEFTHSAQERRKQKDQLRASGASEEARNELSRAHEREADRLAIDAMRQGYRDVVMEGRTLSTQLTSDTGTLVGLCSLIFLRPKFTVATTHPTLTDRIDTLLQALAPPEDSQLWGVACVAFQQWATMWNHNLDLPPAADSYKELYELMLAAARNIR